MKLLIALMIVYVGLNSTVAAAGERSYKKAIDARIKATRSYARARVLVAGISRLEKPARNIYIKSLDKADQHLVDAVSHISRSREHYLDGYHDGFIDEPTATKLREQMKTQDNEITKLKLYVDQMRAHSLKKVSTKLKKTVDDLIVGPDGKSAEKEIIRYLTKIKVLRDSESLIWKTNPATKKFWKKAIADSGFYGRHIKNLVNSAVYVKDRKKVPQRSLDYIKAGVDRFNAYHDQMVSLFDKVVAAKNADFKRRQRKVEELLRPYMKQEVFNRLPSEKALPNLPENPINHIGYIPDRSMMKAFYELNNRPSLVHLEKDINAQRLLRVLYDRGLAHKFMKKFIYSGAKLSIEFISDGNSEDVEYLEFDDILYIPQNIYIGSGDNVNSKELAYLVREIFHAYCKQVVQDGNDPLTKQFLVNVEKWLEGQFVRRVGGESGSSVWVKYYDVIKDSSDFTQEYVASIVEVAFSLHASIWGQVTSVPRSSRISKKIADEKWLKMESTIIDTRYLADQDDGEYWEVQGVPPASALQYIYALFELGEYSLQ